jgi:hypothetical protein
VNATERTRACRLEVGYEQLRRSALEGGAAQGHFGLIILLREGVAAWMQQAPDSLSVSVGTVAKERESTTRLISLEQRAEMTRVLANMVMNTTSIEERCA